jgi:hypothetical protein
LAAGSFSDDPENGGIRREPSLPQHEAIIPEARERMSEFAFDEPADQLARERLLRRRFANVARRSARSRRWPRALRVRPMKKHQLSVYLDKSLMAKVEDLAFWKGQPKSVVAEAAIASFVTPDDSDRREAAFARRLDRLSNG